MTDFLPLFQLEITDADRRAVDEVLAGAWLTAGPRVEAFEEAFARALAAVAPAPHALTPAPSRGERGDVPAGTQHPGMNARPPLPVGRSGRGVSPAAPVTLPGLKTGASVPGTQHSALSTQHSLHAVAVSSCTAALHLALAALAVGPGDEVVLPAINFVAASNVVLRLGARPVFADICALDEPTLCPESTARVASPRTRVVMPMHYAGAPCRMDALAEAAAARGAAVIEDAAHSCITPTPAGACGTLARAGAFSFFSNKNLAVGEGGCLVTADRELAARVRLLRAHGMTAPTLDRHRGHAHSYDVTEAGFNFRWDELRAALALSKLARLDAALARRRVLAHVYDELLARRLPAVTAPLRARFPDVPAHIYPVLLPAETPRDAVLRALRAAGVQCSIHYPLVPGFAVFSGGAAGEWPRAAEYARRVLTLPFFPQMRDEDAERVVAALGGALHECGRIR